MTKDFCHILTSDYRFIGGTSHQEYICDACIINQDYTHFYSMTSHDEHYGFIYHTCACNRFGPIDSLCSALDRDSGFRMNFKVRDRNMHERNVYCISKEYAWAPKKIDFKRYSLLFKLPLLDSEGIEKGTRKRIKLINIYLKDRNCIIIKYSIVT